MNDHTPLPWRIVRTGYRDIWIEASNGRPVCKMANTPEGMRTAEMIVKTVNEDKKYA